MGKQPESCNAKAAKLPWREADRVKKSSDLGNIYNHSNLFDSG
jgi:hypothetical protein